ncbi:hypothetical protein ACFS27_09280 [Promicromonospora vindobonensis]|uniref:DUF4393 domain-containing protein n=1 Tax=Promicromonospora vindobonensis TaxID=195748 RepID=A0ABW5VR46_9MICO
MDPIIAGGLAKAADANANESAKVASNLLIRLLGPAADEYGEQLRQAVGRQRATRAARILSKAEAKSRGRTGSVPPRVAYRVLEDGTLSDDELMAEYLSGVLASSRTPSGRDDRAVTWSSLIGRMSSLQLRAHYVLYREWAIKLAGRDDINLGDVDQRDNARMVLDLEEFIDTVQDEAEPLPKNELLSHAVWGLTEHGLIAKFQYGSTADLKRQELPFKYIIEARPTVVGVELWGWAAGRVGTVKDFVVDPPKLEVDAPIPRPSVLFPTLPARVISHDDDAPDA